MAALSKVIDTNTPSRPVVRLENLNEDVLRNILQELMGYRITVSTVSRLFRGLCMPFIFNHVTLGVLRHSQETPPLNIWPYIHLLTIWISSQNLDDCVLLLSTQLPKRPQIHQIRIRGLQDGVPNRVLQAIFSAPGLKDFYITNCPYMTVEPYDAAISPIVASLRTLVYRTYRVTRRNVSHGLLKRDSEEQTGLQLEAISLWGMLTQINLTIESLFIPGETAQFDLMAELSWPCLRELTLYGLPPVTDTPLSLALSRMPSLRVLHIEFAQLRSNSLFVVCPPGSIYGVLPNLTSLTLSWPSPDDLIFSILPLTLRHLAIQDSPRTRMIYVDSEGSTGNWLPIPATHDLLRILQASDISGLESLEVVYYADSGEADLLNFISTSFPSLYRLEIHRLRPNRWIHRDDDVSIDIIGTTFSACKSLRILYVNPDFYESWLHTPYREQNYPFDKTARMLLESITTLEEVALLYTRYIDDYELCCAWSRYIVNRTNPEGITFSQDHRFDALFNNPLIF